MQVSCLKNLRSKNSSLKNIYNIYCILFIFRKQIICKDGTQNAYVRLEGDRDCTLIENDAIQFEIKCKDNEFLYKKSDGDDWKKIISIECTQPKPGFFFVYLIKTTTTKRVSIIRGSKSRPLRQDKVKERCFVIF